MEGKVGKDSLKVVELEDERWGERTVCFFELEVDE